ncbi:MAG: site-specific integrase [Bacteroidota bacterium]
MAKNTNCIINGKKYFRKYAIIDGKRKMFYGESERDWNKKVDEAKRKESLGLIDTNMSVDKAMGIWIYNALAHKPSIRLSTFSIHEGTYRNRILSSSLSSVNLIDCKSVHIQNLINKQIKDGLSANAIQCSRKVLNMFFKYAVTEGYILKNPCANAYAPKTEVNEEIKVFADDEIERIKIALIGDRYRFLFLFDLATGLRQGEALGFKHKDMKKDSVYVSRQQCTIRHIEQGEKTLYEISDEPLKTDASYREIPLPPSIRKEYLDHKRLCQLEKLKWGRGKLTDDDYLFLSPMGLRCQTGNIQSKWELVLKKAEVDYKSFHSLRHTYITKLVQSNINIVTVMQLAGHSKMSTTLRYTHIEKGFKELTIPIIENMIK